MRDGSRTTYPPLRFAVVIFQTPFIISLAMSEAVALFGFVAGFLGAATTMYVPVMGAGALLVPIAAGISKAHGWAPVFALAMSFNVIAGILALFVLRPMRARHFARGHQAYPSTSDGVVGTRTT